MVRLPSYPGTRVSIFAPAGLRWLVVVGLVVAAGLPRAALAADDEAALRAAVATESARPRVPEFEREQFLAQSSLLGAWLSPDGRQVAALRDEGGSRGVYLLATTGGAARRVLLHADATRLTWTRDSRWLLLESPRQLFALAVAEQPGSRGIAKLGGRPRREFAAVDPVLPAAIIVRETPPLVSRMPRRWRLFRVDMQGRETLLHEDTQPIVDFEFDGRGRLAFVTRAEGDRHVVYQIGRLGPQELREVLRCENLQRCSLVSSGKEGSELLLDTDIGSGYRRLARLDAQGRLVTLHADPRREADLDDVVLDPETRQPLIASYRSTVATNHGLTQQAKRQVEAIEQRYPQRNLRIEVGHGPGARWLVHERAGSMKGQRLHLYDPERGDFRDVFDDSPFRNEGRAVAAIPEKELARKIAFSWRASDGMRLHGFLQLPVGVDPAHAPLVASVHGGPFNLFRPEFNSVSQLLANRGYVVFEPNFRGSTGHGRDYVLAAGGDFGNGRVQQDIVEGVRYLLAQGIGDAQRVGIVGASFGGYSALLGVTFQPELFKVGVAAVPPADLGWVLREYARSGEPPSAAIPPATSMRLLALDPADPVVAERLRAQSPIANAEKLSRSVLLLAGGEDERVPIRSVTHYAAALRALGKDVSLFVDAEGTHRLPSPLTREAYFYLMETMLERHLGGALPKPPSKALQLHLRRNLRLAGKDLSVPGFDAPPGGAGS